MPGVKPEMFLRNELQGTPFTVHNSRRRRKLPMKEPGRNIKGVRICTINVVMLIASCVLFVLVLYTTVQVSVKYQDLIVTTEDYIACEKNAALVHRGSDYLTDEVRLYVETLDRKHADNYFTEINTTRRRDRALENFPKHKTNPGTYAYLGEALEKSNDLTGREIYAIKLVATALGQNMETFPQIVRDTDLSPEHSALDAGKKIDLARSMVFDSAYQDAKKLITSNISYFLNSVILETRQKQQNDTKMLGDILLKQRVVLVILCLLNILIFLMIIVLIIKPLQVYMQCIKEEKMLKITGAYEFKHLALTYNDIYEIKAANNQMLRYKAEHDPLTGLLNRSAFDALKQMFKGRAEPMALLLIDVDYFKQVNDRHGHEMGDKILCRVARLLQDSFRSEDFAIRIGGDEFAMIMTEAVPGMKPIIKNKVEAINLTLQNPCDGLPPVSLSVGAAFSASGFPDSLYGDADSALYDVKARGRRGCGFYEP